MESLNKKWFFKFPLLIFSVCLAVAVFLGCNLSVDGVNGKAATTSKKYVKVKYSLKDIQSIKNLTYSTEVYKNGVTQTPYRVFRTKDKIKVEWLYKKTGDSENVIGTVQYIKPIKFADGNSYKQLKFYNEPNRPGADTGYRGKDLVSPYHIWTQHNVTSLLKSSKVIKEGTGKVENLNVTIYSVANGGKTHKIYYNTKYKTWLKYEIIKNNKVVERYTAKGFKVGGVTNDQADWKTKLPGHPNQEGYALINISSMIGATN